MRLTTRAGTAAMTRRRRHYPADTE